MYIRMHFIYVNVHLYCEYSHCDCTVTCTVGLPHNETTIAEYLKEVGYSTAIVGKWHLGVGANNEYLPTNHGFDQYYVSTYTHNIIINIVCTVCRVC